MQERLIRLEEVMKRTGMSRTAIYDGVKNQTFAKPIKLGKRSVAWIEGEVQDVIDRLIKASRDSAPSNVRGK